MIKKIVSVFIMAALALVIVTGTREYAKNHEKQVTEAVEDIVPDSSNNIIVWYNYKYYTEYLENVAKMFKASRGIDVTLKYVNSNDMLQDIAASNEKGVDMPDIYITGSENIEKAYLLGIARENEFDDIYNTTHFAKQAIEGIKYGNKMYGYPIGFETAAFVYNKKYVTDVPKSFDDIKNYANEVNGMTDSSGKYDAIEKILVWDADNMLYNYGFIGSYIDFSGNYSDKNETVDINKTKLKSSLAYYKSLYEYFSLANEADKYDSIVEDFAAGKIVFTILNIESLRKLDNSDVEYGICGLPSLDQNLSTAMLAITDVAIINPYSDDINMTEEFAKYLTNVSSYEMYERIGILPCKKLAIYKKNELAFIADNYNNCVPLPGFLTLTDYWLKVENLFDKVNSLEDYSSYVDNFIEDLKKGSKYANISEETETQAVTEPVADN